MKRLVKCRSASAKTFVTSTHIYLWRVASHATSLTLQHSVNMSLRTAASSLAPSAAPECVRRSQAARALRPAWQQAPGGGTAGQRRQAAAAGEGRSANRTKWASGDLAGAASGAAAVLEQPAEAAAQQEQQSASELVGTIAGLAWQGGLPANSALCCLPVRMRMRGLPCPVHPTSLPLPSSAGVGCGRRRLPTVC